MVLEDGPTDGQTDGQAGGQTDGRTTGLSELDRLGYGGYWEFYCLCFKKCTRMDNQILGRVGYQMLW